MNLRGTDDSGPPPELPHSAPHDPFLVGETVCSSGTQEAHGVHVAAIPPPRMVLILQNIFL